MDRMQPFNHPYMPAWKYAPPPKEKHTHIDTALGTKQIADASSTTYILQLTVSFTI
jgi:hypothetical protein